MSEPDKLFEVLACPACGASRWTRSGRWAATWIETEDAAVTCGNCGHSYLLKEGVLDFLGLHGEVITPFQRIMQFPPVVALYENYWRRAGYFLASSRSLSPDIEHIVDWIMPERHSVMTDLACGPGLFARRIAERTNGIVIGVDMSWPMLRRARRLSLFGGQSRVVYLRASAFHLPLAAGQIDAICCCGALHLFDEPEAAVAEMQRVLAPGGSLVCQTTIRPDFSAGMATFLDRIIRFGFFEYAELVQMLERHQFRILQQQRHRISLAFEAERTNTEEIS